jgi:hypothetical protein
MLKRMFRMLKRYGRNGVSSATIIAKIFIAEKIPRALISDVAEDRRSNFSS